MALFPADPKKKTTKKVNPAHLTAAKNVVDDGRHHSIIRAPWLSEKALIGTENGVYVFEVPTEATKYQIAAAIVSIYNVTPRQIRVVNLPAKKKALRDRRGFGTRAARHKAYVYLKKGDTIQFA
jgi:large subunit ribosomal protein L23